MHLNFDLLKNEGLFLGPTSGINIAGAIKLGMKLGPNNTIVTVLCDYGTRYASKVFNLKFLKELADDPLRRKPSINLARKELNWQPKIMFKEGLGITREYFEKKLIFEKN